MSETCKTCRFWGKNINSHDVLRATSSCLRVDADRLALVDGTKALIVPFGSKLKTGPDFGCNQWEAYR